MVNKSDIVYLIKITCHQIFFKISNQAGAMSNNNPRQNEAETHYATC